MEKKMRVSWGSVFKPSGQPKVIVTIGEDVVYPTEIRMTPPLIIDGKYLSDYRGHDLEINGDLSKGGTIEVVDIYENTSFINRKENISTLFDSIATEVYSFIKESESEFNEGWVPAAHIKEQLDLKKSSSPQSNKVDNKTGWLFATIARHLEDENKVEFKKNGSRSFYKSSD